jgi:chromosome segregation ATPase
VPNDDAHGAEHERTFGAAYEERTRQLHDARGALAEAVAALTVELGHRREEAAELREQRDLALRDNDALRREVEARGERMVELEEVIRTLRNMKVVRWSASLRGIVYRLRRWR